MQSFGVIIPPSYSATLAWKNSPDPEVVGYRIYCGTASGQYFTNFDAGNVLTREVLGLASGATYFFAVTSYDVNGLESPFSNEIRFVPGTPTIQMSRAAGGQLVLKVKGLIGHTYAIQATQDFKTWTTLGTATLGATGTFNFTDTNAANLANRFYRTRDTLP